MCDGLTSGVRDAPDAALLRLRDIKCAVRSHRDAHRTIGGLLAVLVLARRSRETVGEDLRRTCLAGLVDRHEHHIIAIVMAIGIATARAVKGNKSAAAIRGR